MEPSSINLLPRVREPNDQAAWQRLVELNAPLVFYWGKSEGLNETVAADLVQDVMLLLVHQLAEFEYDPARRFRDWLRTITVNRARDVQRRQAHRSVTGINDTIASVSVADDVELLHRAEYQGHLVLRALVLM